jgi:hypothetical protein
LDLEASSIGGCCHLYRGKSIEVQGIARDDEKVDGKGGAPLKRARLTRELKAEAAEQLLQAQERAQALATRWRRGE